MTWIASQATHWKTRGEVCWINGWTSKTPKAKSRASARISAGCSTALVRSSTTSPSPNKLKIWDSNCLVSVSCWRMTLSEFVYDKQMWCVRKFIRNSAVATWARTSDCSQPQLGNREACVSKRCSFSWRARCATSSVERNDWCRKTEPSPVRTWNLWVLGSSEPTPEEPLRRRGAQGGSGSSPPNWIPNLGVQVGRERAFWYRVRGIWNAKLGRSPEMSMDVSDVKVTDEDQSCHQRNCNCSTKGTEFAPWALPAWYHWWNAVTLEISCWRARRVFRRCLQLRTKLRTRCSLSFGSVIQVPSRTSTTKRCDVVERGPVARSTSMTVSQRKGLWLQSTNRLRKLVTLTFTLARICTPMSCCQAADGVSSICDEDQRGCSTRRKHHHLRRWVVRCTEVLLQSCFIGKASGNEIRQPSSDCTDLARLCRADRMHGRSQRIARAPWRLAHGWLPWVKAKDSGMMKGPANLQGARVVRAAEN